MLKEINSNAVDGPSKPPKLSRVPSKVTPVDHKAANAKLKGIMDADPTTDLIKNLPKVQKPSFVKHTEKMRKEVSTA